MFLRDPLVIGTDVKILNIFSGVTPMGTQLYLPPDAQARLRMLVEASSRSDRKDATRGDEQEGVSNKRVDQAKLIKRTSGG